MVDFQGRRRWRAALYSRPVAALLALGVLLLGQSVFRVYMRSRAVARERALAALALTELEARQSELKAEIGALKTDQGVEQEIRKKFPVVREGEKVIVVVPEEAEAVVPGSARLPGWWGRLKSWF